MVINPTLHMQMQVERSKRIGYNRDEIQRQLGKFNMIRNYECRLYRQEEHDVVMPLGSYTKILHDTIMWLITMSDQ